MSGSIWGNDQDQGGPPHSGDPRYPDQPRYAGESRPAGGPQYQEQPRRGQRDAPPPNPGPGYGDRSYQGRHGAYPPGQHGQPGDPGPRHPSGPQQRPGGGGWEQEDDSFVPGFDRREDYDDGRRGAPGRDRYDDGYDRGAYHDGAYDDGAYDDGAYDSSQGPRWPDGRGIGPGGPSGGGPGAGRGPAADRGYGGRGVPDDRGWDDGRGWDGDRGWNGPAAAGGDRYRGSRTPPRKRATRWAPRILVLVVVLALVVGGLTGGLYVYHKYEARFHPADYAGQGTGSVTVHVPSGATAFSLAPELLSLHVIASERAFTNAAEAAPSTTATGSSGLEAGYYQLHYNMKASLAYAALLNPKNVLQTVVTIPEGKRAVDVIAKLSQQTKIPLKNFQQVLKNPGQLGLPSYAGGKVEGYLFPATYAIEPHESALAILQSMVQRFNLEASTTDLVNAARSAGLTPTKVIIEASLAQAEGGSVSDYPKIIEVINNRLSRGMHLQFDSTVLYGLGKYAVSATNKQIRTPGPYNTYLNAGLPAGPISNPGDAAIQAVLHPATGNYLFFLTKPGGKSEFSADPLKGQ